jgi:hypothetical protein
VSLILWWVMIDKSALKRPVLTASPSVQRMSSSLQLQLQIDDVVEESLSWLPSQPCVPLRPTIVDQKSE